MRFITRPKKLYIRKPGKKTGYIEYVPGTNKAMRETKLDPITNKIDMTIYYNQGHC
jgi:hypothetical protein